MMPARTTPDVRLTTAVRVQRILEGEGVPLTRKRLLARLAAGGHKTTGPRLDRALGFFFDLGLAVEGSKGVQWTHSQSDSLDRARATGRQLCR